MGKSGNLFSEYQINQPCGKYEYCLTVHRNYAIMKVSSERKWVLILNVKFYIISYIFLIVFVRILPPVLRKKSGRNLQQSATEHIEQNALQKGRGIMKNQNQIKVFVSVFLALLSIQGTAMQQRWNLYRLPRNRPNRWKKL